MRAGLHRPDVPQPHHRREERQSRSAFLFGPADTASLLCSAALAVLVGLGIHKLHIGTPRGACLWAAMAADECIRALLFLWRWRTGAWRRKPLLNR